MLRNAEQDAAGKGVVGVRDYEMAENIDTWIDRFKQGLDGLRIEAGVYPERLQQAIDDGWHTGDELPGSHGLGHVGAMKMISDGSLNTRSAYCSTPYSGITPETYGTLSYTPEQIESYMRLATEHGFDIACHAIGDEANTIVLDCAERTHAHGSIEHAQMLKERDIPRLAQLGLAASIQPQHAMDDRDVITRSGQSRRNSLRVQQSASGWNQTAYGIGRAGRAVGSVAGHFRSGVRHGEFRPGAFPV